MLNRISIAIPRLRAEVLVRTVEGIEAETAAGVVGVPVAADAVAVAGGMDAAATAVVMGDTAAGDGTNRNLNLPPNFFSADSRGFHG